MADEIKEEHTCENCDFMQPDGCSFSLDTGEQCFDKDGWQPRNCDDCKNDGDDGYCETNCFNKNKWQSVKESKEIITEWDGEGKSGIIYTKEKPVNKVIFSKAGDNYFGSENKTKWNEGGKSGEIYKGEESKEEISKEGLKEKREALWQRLYFKIETKETHNLLSLFNEIIEEGERREREMIINWISKTDILNMSLEEIIRKLRG